mmetsp:Transcript_14406/g.39530  ORF Transcript_14406/g.39530 Transcript_14406/m.39530 type:complete len:584 (-) Transcript_14406:957-2708(-)
MGPDGERVRGLTALVGVRIEGGVRLHGGHFLAASQGFERVVGTQARVKLGGVDLGLELVGPALGFGRVLVLRGIVLALDGGARHLAPGHALLHVKREFRLRLRLRKRLQLSLLFLLGFLLLLLFGNLAPEVVLAHLFAVPLQHLARLRLLSRDLLLALLLREQLRDGPVLLLPLLFLRFAIGRLVVARLVVAAEQETVPILGQGRREEQLGIRLHLALRLEGDGLDLLGKYHRESLHESHALAWSLRLRRKHHVKDGLELAPALANFQVQALAERRDVRLDGLTEPCEVGAHGHQRRLGHLRVDVHALELLVRGEDGQGHLRRGPDRSRVHRHRGRVDLEKALHVHRLHVRGEVAHVGVGESGDDRLVVGDELRVLADDPRNGLESLGHGGVALAPLQQGGVQEQGLQNGHRGLPHDLNPEADVHELVAHHPAVRRRRHAHEIGKHREVPHKVGDERVPVVHADVDHAPHQLVPKPLFRLAHGAHEERGGVHERLLGHEPSHNLERAVLDVGVLVLDAPEDISLVFRHDPRVGLEEEGERVEGEEFDVWVRVVEHVLQLVNRLPHNLLLACHPRHDRANALVQ